VTLKLLKAIEWASTCDELIMDLASMSKNKLEISNSFYIVQEPCDKFLQTKLSFRVYLAIMTKNTAEFVSIFIKRRKKECGIAFL